MFCGRIEAGVLIVAVMTSENLPPVLVITGPTASGKSALALDAAGAFDGTVINADSMQVYRELKILTARPSVEAEKRVPHKLFGVLPTSEPCSAGRWLKMAVAEIEAAHSRGSLPIVVGGTGLYIKALTEGLAEIPDISEDIRAEARTLHASLGGEAFRAELAKLDPEAAAKLPVGDSQRLVRAFEVARATGRPLANWQDEVAPAMGLGARFATIALIPPRQLLYAACEARVDLMIAAGAVAEVKALAALGLAPGLPALKAVGVPELSRHLRGEASLEEAVGAAKRATRNYAKRQLTWLRTQGTGAWTLSAQYSESLRLKIFSFICRFLLTLQ